MKPSEPVRVLSEASREGAPEDLRKLASLFGRVSEPRPLDDAALSRVYRRVRGATQARPRRTLGFVRWAVVGVLGLSAGVVAAAQSGLLRGRIEIGPLVVTLGAPPARSGPRRPRPPRAAEERLEPPAPPASVPPLPAPAAPSPAVASPAVASPAVASPAVAALTNEAGRRPRARRRVQLAAAAAVPQPEANAAVAAMPAVPEPLPPGPELAPAALPPMAPPRGASSSWPAPGSVRPEPPRAPGPLAQESALLAQALGKLRHARDAEGALVDLRAYAQRFPRGLLSHEAQRARIDAYLVLNRRSEALALLGDAQLGNTGRDAELRVIRAELLGLSRCERAVTDFTAVLAAAGGVSDDVKERALWGRARCLGRLGRDREAAADRAAYLARFPEGRFARALR
ncbi:MAG: hypothetical protein KA712_11885 [Myxococcales bacterium]|nr:hypothetical protein [Myxococcales bacterium]